MNDKELERIMNDELEGLTTPEESERLRQALAVDPRARDTFQRLGTTFETLDQVPLVDPPGEIRFNVLRAVHRPQSVPVRGWLESIRAAFRKRPVFRYAYSFAAGAGVGVIVFALATGDLLTGSRQAGPFSGAMLPASEVTTFRKVDSRELRWKGGSVTAEVRSTRDGIVTRLNAAATRGTEIVVTYDESALDVVALRQGAAARNDVSLGQGRLSIWVRDPAPGEYLLYLARRGPAGSPMRLSIHSPDGFLQGELRTGATPSGG